MTWGHVISRLLQGIQSLIAGALLAILICCAIAPVAGCIFVVVYKQPQIWTAQCMHLPAMHGPGQPVMLWYMLGLHDGCHVRSWQSVLRSKLVISLRLDIHPLLETGIA